MRPAAGPSFRGPPLPRLRVQVPRQRLPAVQYDLAIGSSRLPPLREGLQRLDRDLRRVRRVDRPGPGWTPSSRSDDGPRVDPRNLGGASERPRRPRLPGFLRRRTPRPAGDGGPVGPPSRDRTKSSARGSDRRARATGKRSAVSDLRGSVDRDRGSMRDLWLSRRVRPRSGRRGAEARGDHGRDRRPGPRRRFPGDARGGPRRVRAGLRRGGPRGFPPRGMPAPAWRQKGFDVAPVEQLLAEDLSSFRAGGTRLIRLQAMKKAGSGAYRCPLCEISVESTAEECGNCGARFA